jgi:hypothetical protein
MYSHAHGGLKQNNPAGEVVQPQRGTSVTDELLRGGKMGRRIRLRGFISTGDLSLRRPSALARKVACFEISGLIIREEWYTADRDQNQATEEYCVGLLLADPAVSNATTS